MNDAQKHKLLGWLNSAHAMESGLVEVLERQVKLAETEGEPEVAAAIESYAAEHMEIAVYESLAAAAEILEDQETVEMCNEIIQEEESMAEWLREQLPVATRLYVAELE